MTRKDLLSRGFEFKVVVQRKPVGESFTIKEYSGSVEEALRQLPADLQVTEIAIETSVARVSDKEELDMETIIYWKEQ